MSMAKLESKFIFWCHKLLTFMHIFLIIKNPTELHEIPCIPKHFTTKYTYLPISFAYRAHTELSRLLHSLLCALAGAHRGLRSRGTP